VAAVFNLSDRAVAVDRAAYGAPIEGTGFEASVDGGGRLLPFGVLFAELVRVPA
jgi:hypothetical protein